MPLRAVQFPSDPVSLKNVEERIFIFFSSRLPESNALWCPDCATVEDLIRNTFSAEQGPRAAVIVYVGQRSEWKTPDNIFRKAPWNVTSIPTIIRLNEAGEEIGRLVDGRNSIPDELATFLQ